MISTQPGSTPLSRYVSLYLPHDSPSFSSFKIVSLEEELPGLTASHGNDIGPYGDQVTLELSVTPMLVAFIRLISLTRSKVPRLSS